MQNAVDAVVEEITVHHSLSKMVHVVDVVAVDMFVAFADVDVVGAFDLADVSKTAQSLAVEEEDVVEVDIVVDSVLVADETNDVHYCCLMPCSVGSQLQCLFS